VECEVCGHESEDAFEVVRHVGRHTFDTFECAIYALAPQCAQCGVRVMGHGVKDDDHIFCCAHCAEAGPREEANPGKSDGGAASDNGHSNQAEDHADADADSDDDDSDDADSDEDDSDDDDSSADDDDAAAADDDEDEEDEEDEEQKLDKLEERISQARQNADDLLSGPEDEADQDESGVETETETETGDKDKDKDKDK
jgi:hypothetical protein